MILRVEDTDAERKQAGIGARNPGWTAVAGRGLGRGAVYQSQRTELYRAAAKKLLANGSGIFVLLPRRKVRGRGPRGAWADEEPKGGGRAVSRAALAVTASLQIQK